MVKHGALVNKHDNQGRTPIYALCLSDEKPSADTWLSKQEGSSSSLTVSAATVLVTAGAIVNPTSCSPLLVSLSKGNLPLAQYLYEQDADCCGDTINPSAFQVAVSTNSEKVLELILNWDRLKFDWTFIQNGKNFLHRIALKKGSAILTRLIPLVVDKPFANELVSLRMDERPWSVPLFCTFPDLELARM